MPVIEPLASRTAVVCTGAIRDEGVSHHYAPAEKFAWPSETLTRRLTQALTADGTAPHSGLAWTIDAPYRETVAEARSWQAEGGRRELQCLRLRCRVPVTSGVMSVSERRPAGRTAVPPARPGLT
jgi:hypothetical protein